MLSPDLRIILLELKIYKKNSKIKFTLFYNTAGINLAIPWRLAPQEIARLWPWRLDLQGRFELNFIYNFNYLSLMELMKIDKKKYENKINEIS